jgi:hypothetical protein
MNRWFGVLGACVLVGAIALSAQPSDQGRRGGGQGGASQGGGRQGGARQGGSQSTESQELKQAREALQRDIAEGKRLMEQLKLDRKAGDREAVQRDNEALKRNREQIKKDQDLIKQLVSNHGRGRGRGRL